MSFRKISQPNFLQRVLVQKKFWIVFCCFFFAYPIYRSLTRVLPDSLKPIYTLPSYNLIDENGLSFGSQELEGKPYIASFFFTTCPTVCREIMSEMQKIQKRVKGLGDHVALISFTVDPETDTPQVLFRRARELHANPYVWKFLTGSKEEMRSLLVDSFKVPMGEKEASGNLLDIAHSVKLVLVNGKGQILKYYSTDRVSIDQMMIDLGLLINRDKLVFKSKGEQ